MDFEYLSNKYQLNQIEKNILIYLYKNINEIKKLVLGKLLGITIHLQPLSINYVKN